MNMDWLPKEIIQAIDRLDLGLSVASVPEIDTLLSKTVLFRGKKFRPTLCFLMAQAFGVDLKGAQPYARAAEFVHAATLAHDDVIDESPTRRKRPTLNARSSNARAVLAGDLLLARVMAELSALGKIEIIADLANTVEELVSGEWLQLEARQVGRVNRGHLETVAKKKTASLMAWCCATALRLAGREPEWIDAARLFGESLGVAFQMIDDIIDYDADGEKPFAQDIREGLVNFVTLEMLEANPALFEPIQKLLGAVPAEGPGAWPWREEDVLTACKKVRARADAKLEVAEQLLNQMVQSLGPLNQDAVQALRSIINYLRERVR
jgi:octaprenyl-diphosphate synthase